MRRRRTEREVLRARCDAAARQVDIHAAALARASAVHLAAPESREARDRLENAEELHYLALWELRRARRTLARRDAFDSVVARLTLDVLPRR
jgi:hypothetical protein